MAAATTAITGLLETALYVGDLERAAHFYETVLGFPRIFGDGRLIGLAVPGRQVLLLFREGASTEPSTTPGGTIPPHDGHGDLHLAFAIGADDVDAWKDRLAANGVPIESRVTGERGGTCLYFRDPDHHLLELATPGLWSVY